MKKQSMRKTARGESSMSRRYGSLISCTFFLACASPVFAQDYDPANFTEKEFDAWMAQNRDAILAEWQKRYANKSEAKK